MWNNMVYVSIIVYNALPLEAYVKIEFRDFKQHLSNIITIDT